MIIRFANRINMKKTTSLCWMSELIVVNRQDNGRSSLIWFMQFAPVQHSINLVREREEGVEKGKVELTLC